MPTFSRTVALPVRAAAAYAWHARPGAFLRLQPGWGAAEVVARGVGIVDGARVELRVPTPLGRRRWVAEHRGCQAGAEFTDVQIDGPFAAWEHRHRFVDAAAGSTLEDRIAWRLPPLLALGGGTVERSLDRLFAWRHRVTAGDLGRHAAAALPPQRIAVSGASGFVGAALAAFLDAGGHTVLPLARCARAGALAWDVVRGVGADADGLDAVVHLAGENIHARRWSPAFKARIADSRIAATAALCRSLAALPRPPRTLIAASAIGIYGDRGDTELDEASTPGVGFLADVCRGWEAATAPLAERGCRVVHLRIGMVLGAGGGALAQLDLPARLGLAGPIGDGRMWQSWIGRDDLLALVLHCLARDVRGPVNAVAPQPVRQRDFMRTLGAVLHRPACVPAPAAAVRLAFGELADAVLLSSMRVVPRAALADGFRFDWGDLAACLRHELGR